MPNRIAEINQMTMFFGKTVFLPNKKKNQNKILTSGYRPWEPAAVEISKQIFSTIASIFNQLNA